MPRHEFMSEHNKMILASMRDAVNYGVEVARTGGNFSTAMCKERYESGVESESLDIFWEDYKKMAKLAYDTFLGNGGEF